MSGKQHRAYREFYAADRAWAAELEREFGGDAGTARYQSRGQGSPGSALRAAAEEYTRAGAAWREANGIGDTVAKTVLRVVGERTSAAEAERKTAS